MHFKDKKSSYTFISFWIYWQINVFWTLLFEFKICFVKLVTINSRKLLIESVIGILLVFMCISKRQGVIDPRSDYVL